uniref:Uncharacterized protein n=1 Tax=uncultured marine crenarchaeote HF4000_APKG6C9 TaxID=455595 RepID=B3T8X6_9ARCH|nr:hypothetical protein ALOHA_HF4000APKG6C9ctg1g32 [uncultured marine crenarchaeote HF4000_APKG6C9]
MYILNQKHSTKSKVLTILAVSLVATFILSMAVVEQAWGTSTLGAPTSLRECKAPTEAIIYLCWDAPTITSAKGGAISSYFIQNVTETCTGSGANYSCSFGSYYYTALNAVASPGTNSTGATSGGGTGSAITIGNFTGLSSGQMFKFKVMALNAHGNGTLTSAFQAGTLLGASFDYSSKPTQSFGNGTNFGANTTFADEQSFSNFQNFGVGQVFGSGTVFAEDQTFNGTQNFSDGSIKFDAGTQFDTVQTFGSSANFTGSTVFTGANTFGIDAVFGDGVNFPAGQSFGKGAEFTGKAVFGATQTFPIDAIFAIGQEFTAGSTYTFDDFAQFKTGTDFGAARTFDVGTMFDSAMIFYEGSTFTDAAMFGDSQTFSSAMTFANNMHFGANTDFTALAQTFKPGTTFDPGTTFAVGQVMPLNSVPSSGLMLEAFTCVDAACVPPAGSILSPGEFLTPGTDPVEILSTVSSSSPDVSIPGLGFIMNFTTVSSNGKTSVDPIDPALLTGSSTALKNTGTGSRSIEIGGAGGALFDTVGTALNISLSDASVSGDITIQMPYDESSIGDTSESDLAVLHYTGGQWQEQSNCTVDTTANTITCTVTSLSPFSVGSSVASNKAGGRVCDTDGFGPGKSLEVDTISWDILEAKEVVVIAGSTCGPINFMVYTQKSVVAGGLTHDQPYLAENMVILKASIDIPESDFFKIVVKNDRNSFEQIIYPELHGTEGAAIFSSTSEFASKAQYAQAKMYSKDDPHLVIDLSLEGALDPEPQLTREAIHHVIMRPNYDLEPQLTMEAIYTTQVMTDSEPQVIMKQKRVSSSGFDNETILMGGVGEVQEKQKSFWDWMFSLFS